MPTILTYFDAPGYYDYPFDDPTYVESYHRMAAEVQQRGGEFWIVRSPETYNGNMTFSRGWKFVNHTFQEVSASIQGDLMYIKGYQLRTGSHDRLLNPAGLGAVCGIDKQRTYEMFAQYHPLTVEVKSQDALKDAVEHIRADTVVIKPVSGFGGEGVFIVPKQEALKQHYQYPVIVQEFVDTSQGIPGITPSYHDYRILMMDGRVFMTVLRVPAAGKKISNVSQGGTMTVVPAHLRPPALENIIAGIEDTLTVFKHRYYSIDCGRDSSGRWFVFELNDQPGLMTPQECGPFADQFYGGLAEYLLLCAAD